MNTEMPQCAVARPGNWKWLLVALFAVVLGSKLVLIHLYGNVTPFWDQWNAEADLLYRPYLDGTLKWANMVAPHNEHRIFVTRVLGLILLEAAGEWNPMLEMVVNAILHSTFIVLLALLMGKLISLGDRFLLVALMAGLFMIPIGWENLLAGFQSQFYFVLIFSLLALFLMVPAAAFSPLWIGGLVFAVASYFSFASGAFTPLAAAATAAFQIVFGARRATAREWSAILTLVLVATFMIMNVPTLAHHAVLQAHSPQQFVMALIQIASAPIPVVGLVLHLPLVVYAVWVLRNSDQATPRDWLVLAMGGWIVMQMISLAYGRAIDTTAARYLDLMIVLLPLDFVALRCISGNCRFATYFSGSWLFILIVGMSVMTVFDFVPQLVERGRVSRAQENNVAAYLSSGDIAHLQNKPPLEVPYPAEQQLAEYLSNPIIRAIMPMELRPPDAMVDEVRSRLIADGRFALWTSRALRGSQKYGGFLIGFGFALFFILALPQATGGSEPRVPEKRF